MAYRRDIPERILDAVCRDATDPIERIFSFVVHYRQGIMENANRAGRSMGGLLVGAHEPDLTREFLAANFEARTDMVLQCLLEVGNRLPEVVDRLSLAQFVSTTIEGALMHARALGDLAYFDRAVQELRNYIEMLLYGGPGLSDPVREVLSEIGDQRPKAHFPMAD